MNMKMKIIFISIFVILISLSLSLPKEIYAKPNLSFIKEQITDTSVQENAPIVNNNIVVYRRHYSPDVDIFKYDLKTKEESILVQRSGHQSPVQLFGNYLLYNEEVANDDTNVRVKNIKTGEDFPIIEDAGYQIGGGIWGDKVAYINDYNCGQLSIYSISQKTHTDTPYTACQIMRMSGNFIVWEQNYNIYGYNIESGQKFDIATTSDDETMPNIFADSVV